MPTCPSGHDSTADDYCDVCGLPITDAGPAPTPAGDAPAAPPETGRADPGRARGRDLPELLGAQPGERALLRGLRLRLHDRPGAARAVARSTWTRRSTPGRRTHRTPADADPARPTRRTAESAAVDRAAARRRSWVAEVWIDPGLVRRPGLLRSAALGRGAGRRTAEDDVDPRRPHLAQPQHPPRHRPDHRQRHQPAALPVHDRRQPLVGGGPRLVQRHLRRRHRSACCRPTRCARARSARSPPTSGSTSARGAGS